MKKTIYLVLYLLVFSLLSCETVYYYNTEPAKTQNNELQLLFLLDTLAPNIQFWFVVNKDKPIDNFIINRLNIQIGENNIEFDNSNIKYSGSETDTLYFIALYKNGVKNIEDLNEFNKRKINAKETNNYQYLINITGYVERNLGQIGNEIRKNKKSNLKVHIEYSFLIDDDTIYETLDEEFTLITKKGLITIFHLLNPAYY